MKNAFRQKGLCSSLVVAFLLSGCMSQGVSVASRDVYSGSQTSRLMKVEQCKVVSSRAIVISPDDAGAKQREATSGAVGGIAGGAIGYTLAKKIGAGDGNDLAKVLGTAVGYQIGQNAARSGSRQNQLKPGVAYQIKTSSGVRQVVQEVSMTTEVLPAGSNCSLVYDRGQARVLP
jgi:outer membrane lipoprotein SlyB